MYHKFRYNLSCRPMKKEKIVNVFYQTHKNNPSVSHRGKEEMNNMKITVLLTKDFRCWQLSVTLPQWQHQSETVEFRTQRTSGRVNRRLGKGMETKKCVYTSFNCIIIVSFPVTIRSALIMIWLLRFQLHLQWILGFTKVYFPFAHKQDFDHNKLKDIKFLQKKISNYTKSGETTGRELTRSSAWSMLANNGIKTPSWYPSIIPELC